MASEDPLLEVQNLSVHFALPGTWAGEAPIGYAFQWLRCLNTCEAIPGATEDRFELGPTEIGARLAVTVTATMALAQSPAATTRSTPRIEANVPL